MSPDNAEATVSAAAIMQRNILPESKVPSIKVPPSISLSDLSNVKATTQGQPDNTGPRADRSKSRAKWMPISERQGNDDSAAEFDPTASVASSFYLPAEPQSARSRSRGSDF